jgi:ABC-2 type transport system permease protein
MSSVRLLWHQFSYDQKLFWREPSAVFFTVALPVAFLFLFAGVLGSRPAVVDGRSLPGSVYYVPAIVTLGLVTATFVNIAISLTIARERGLLARVRSTPLPAWVYLAARAATSVVVGLVLAAVLAGLGRIAFGVALPVAALPGALLALGVGAAAFSALGFAVSAVIPSENAAPPLTNVLVLPLLLASGVFVESSSLPQGLQRAADVLPVKPLFEALLLAFTPGAGFPGIAWGKLAVVALWGVAGAVVAVRFFRWFPRER